VPVRQTSLLTTAAWWLAAASISERASDNAARKDGGTVSSDQSRFRLEGWRSQPPFHEEEWFERRLSKWGIDRAHFEYLISDEALASRAAHDQVPPRWADRINRLYGGPQGCIEDGDSVEPETGTRGLIALVRPLTREAIRRVAPVLHAFRSECEEPGIDVDRVTAALSQALDGLMMPAIGRVCALELNVRSLENRLEGGSPAERFAAFVAELTKPAVAGEILRAYPVLARHLVSLIDNWVASTEEWLQRLRMDFDDVRATFLSQGGTPLVGVEPTGADRHAGGRTPVVLVFHSGRRVVYKPRSLALDRHFGDLIAWMNAQGLHPDLRTVRLIDKGSHGWCEFIEHRACRSIDEIADFYRRQGAYLALFYALGSSDFHRENLIAHGSYPVPVDLETLFSPEVKPKEERRAPSLAHRAIAESVLRVGLLPRRVWGSDQWSGIDLSGLEGDPAQQTPFGVLTWSEPHEDDVLRLVRRPMPLGAAINRPVLDGAPIAAAEHVSLILDGFERAYNLLRSVRPALCAESGPLAAFRNDEVRVVLRPTLTYSVLLQESYHPDYLQDAADQDRLLDLLWATAPYAEHLEAAVVFEQEDLRAGDVPRFITRAGQHDLWAGRDREVPYRFDRSCLDTALTRLGRLDDEDLVRQQWLVKASLATAARETQQGWIRYAIEPVSADAGAMRLRAGELAASIGERLAALAYHGESDITWIGLTVSRDERWSLAPMRTSVYDGLAGIALFFGYLGTIRGDEKFLDLARRTAASVKATWRADIAAQPSIGGFSGLGGLIYALTHLSGVLHDSELLRTAQDMVRELPRLIPRDQEFDVIGGAAGCIAGLLTLWQSAPSDEVIEQAVACGHHLVATATEYPSGCGWVRLEMAPVALAGFAHGAAGIAWALHKLSVATRVDTFNACAASALEYERTLFSEDLENWRDARDRGVPSNGPEAPAKFSTAWCHGAAGIGLSRVALLQGMGDRALHSDLAAAVRTTRRTGFGLNHSLCHGDLGNLELLMQAARLPEFAERRQEAQSIAAGIVDDIDRNGARCGIPLQAESPGLMTGLAGIGMGLLRIAAGERVPCVPMLDPALPISSSYTNHVTGPAVYRK
jgi:type 2 lantibiotic biosynthesis protein LanM